MPTLASIDIGSNAMRLAIGSFQNYDQLKVFKTYRESVRLGADVFKAGRLSTNTMTLAVDALKLFRRKMEKYDVDNYRAVGTSALREAKNSQDFLKLAKRDSWLEVGVIDGLEEARLIQLAVVHNLDLKDAPSLLIDLGGGSLEVSLIRGKEVLFRESAALGAVRQLSCTVEVEKELSDLCARISTALGKTKIAVVVGSGGSIEALGVIKTRLTKSEDSSRLNADELKRIEQEICTLSIEERMQKFDLKRDRADVIGPAVLVVAGLVRKLAIKEILIPHVGLREGVLLALAEERAPSVNLFNEMKLVIT